jgi:hypothetical protein
MDINEKVIMSLETYDHLQMKLVELQTEVERLRKELDGIRVFELEDGCNGRKELIYTDFALKQYVELVDGNPHLEFKELKKMADWDIAKPKPEVVEADA